MSNTGEAEKCYVPHSAKKINPNNQIATEGAKQRPLLFLEKNNIIKKIYYKSFMKLEITASTSKILEIQPKKNFFIEIIKIVLKFLEKYFGSEILVKIPPELHDLDDKILKTINVAHELKFFGIIKNIIKYPRYSDEPFLYNYYAPSINGASGSGVHFFDEEKAVWRSLAEATERYFWFNSDRFFKKTIDDSYKNLKGKALDIFSLSGFSAEQKDRHIILRFDENSVFGWIPAYSLTKNGKTFCPVQLVSALYSKQKVKRWENDSNPESMLRWCVTTGLATGRNLEEAIVKGILEIVERDAFMIVYLNKLSPPIIDLEHLSYQDEEIAKIVKSFKRYNLEIYVLQLPTDFPVYVNLAIIIDRTGLGPALSVGASADFDFKTAFLDALSESLIIRYSLKNKFRQEIDLGKIGREERTIYWAKIENLPKIEFFLKGPAKKFDFEQNFYEIDDNQNYYKEKLKILSEDLKKKNYEACYVELSDKKTKKLGLRCVQAVIPKLQPLHLNESIPYFVGERLKEIPLKLGYQSAKVLNQEPHPFP